MTRDVHVRCGGIRHSAESVAGAKVKVVDLDLAPSCGNVRLKLSDVSGFVRTNLSDPLLDLLEIAAYVYAADQSVPRSNQADLTGSSWRRRIRVGLPVRLPELWNSVPVRAALAEALGFATDDDYDFEFACNARPWAEQPYLDFNGTPYSGEIDEVALYSGGLDSLAGAVDAAVNRNRRTLLVTHRSNEKHTPVINANVARLRDRLGEHAPIPLVVHANKSKDLSRDVTQRSRMFLYATLGCVAATLLGKDELRVYENGVVGLNLPILGQLVGARASRTTHPRTLLLLSRLFSVVLDKPFAIANPFLWNTKADVVRIIDAGGFPDLIASASSCGGTIGASKVKTHCGVCSQCIDRRFGILAADLGDWEPADHYAVDLIRDERTKAEDRTMLVGYLDRARRIDAMEPPEFFASYGEAARALPREFGRPSETARKVYDLYKRHARDVMGVVASAIREDVERMARGVKPSPLVALIVTPPAECVDAVPTEPDNLFRCRGDFWELRFEGSTKTYAKNCEGLRWIARLLRHPGHPIRNTDLTDETEDANVAEVVQSGVPHLDGTTVAACRARMADLDLLIEAARERGEIEEAEEYQEERNRIDGYLRSGTNRRGNSRLQPSAVERARKLVANNIKNAVKAVGRHDAALADHLKRHIRNQDGACTYDPQPPVLWET